MLDVRCPRCNQVWYTPCENGGRVRLCPGCEQELRAAGGEPMPAVRVKKRRRWRWRRLPIDPFLAFLLAVTFFDVLFILLARIWPRQLGPLLLVYGFGLCLAGSVARRVTWWTGNPDEGGWWIVALLGGLCATGAYFALVAPKLQGRDSVDPAPSWLIGKWQSDTGETKEFYPSGVMVHTTRQGVFTMHYKVVDRENIEFVPVGGDPVRFRLEGFGGNEIVITGSHRRERLTRAP